MHPKAIESVVGQLTKVAENLVYPIGPDAGKPILQGTERIGGYMQNPVGAETERLLVEHLLEKHRWSKKVSEKFLCDRFSEMLQVVEDTRSTEHIRGEVQQLVEEVEGMDKWRTVLVPLTGIKIEDGADFQLGNVLVRDMTGDRGQEVLEFHRSIAMRNPHFSAEENQRRFDRFRSFLDNVTGGACAEYKVVAERKRAEELAVEETRRAIDLLRFAILNLARAGWRHVVGVQGEVCQDTLTVLSHLEDGTRGDYSESAVHFKFVVNQIVLQKMRKIGVFELSDLLRQAELTEFEQIILRGVHWLASAQSQPENQNALLNLVTCLETFMKTTKDDPITATIAEGVAILTAKGLDERRLRKKRIKDFYGMRSRLSHEGEGEILEADLRELTGIARDLTMQMIQRRSEFKKHEELRSWIDDEKLR